MLDELGIWLTRIALFLPEIIGLYEAAKGNENQQLEASLRLVRKMKDVQMREELGG